MNFLYPSMIGIAAAAIGLPLAIHFLTRPRPVRFPLSTIRFVREAVAQKKSRHRLRDILVLLSRMAAIGLLGWAFARPLFHERSLISLDGQVDVRRVVILDVSQSMAASTSGIGRFELARARAAQYLKARNGLTANLVLAGAQSRAVFDRLSSSFAVMNDTLNACHVTAEKANIQPAINEAARLLAMDAAPGAAMELVVISDFQRTNWATADFSPLPEATKIQLESVAPETPASNLAIESVRFDGRMTRGAETNVQVVVANYSDAPRDVRCEVAFDNHAFTVSGRCPPLVKTPLTQSVVVNEGGWMHGTARLLNHTDDLPADDVCPLVVQVRTVSTYGIVTREPASRIASATYFLERAIAPYPPERAADQPRIVRINPSELSHQTMGQCELLILARPGKLELEQINLLASYLRRGRAMLYLTNELVDANNFKLLSTAAGQELQPPVELLPTLREDKRDGYTITNVRTQQRPFVAFGDALQPLLAGIRVVGGLRTRLMPNALDDDLLATLNDRSALLFIGTVGAGSVAVFNADLAASNLPRQSAFVPLIAELTDQLLPDSDVQATAYCGEPLTRLLPPEAGSVDALQAIQFSIAAIGVPEGRTLADVGQLRQSGDGILWQWNDAREPGIVSVTSGKDRVFSLALKAPPEESDLRTLDANVFTDRLAGGRVVRFRQTSGSGSNRDDSWIWFAAGCVVAMLGEIVALKHFRT